jgi:RecA-family ATPase
LKIAVPCTAREYLPKVLADAGRAQAFYGEAYLLPFQIESLKLENVRPFQDFEAKFRKDALNVIYGPCGSGKSTIIRSILFAFGKWPHIFPSQKTGK